MSDRAYLHEVAPRDGLQNEAVVLPTAAKLKLVRRLAAAGPDSIELTSFVRPDRVPALADAAELAAAVAAEPWRRRLDLYALVLNRRGFATFLASGLDGITLVVSVTEGHSRANAGRPVAQALAGAVELCRRAKQAGRKVRAVLSMAFGCPFDGTPDPTRVEELAAALAEAEPDVLLLADTLGVGTPEQVEDLGGRLLRLLPGHRLGLHLHATHGRAEANALAGWRLGLRHFDAAAGGSGGCPFAPGAAGNLASEDLVRVLRAAGAELAVDEEALAAASRYLGTALAEAGGDRSPPSAR
ncbi:MAG: hydroxymethylglutaryl-CoA lyase [Planctomycetota bacterium]|nr:MAG: hydroxymethylglutaryl-CoA lyase [Planctomycetota bacterium]